MSSSMYSERGGPINDPLSFLGDWLHEAPVLKRIELPCTPQLWTSRFLQDLTYLDVDDSTDYGFSDVCELLQALERMPALQVLRLVSSGILSRRSPRPSLVLSDVHLSELQEIELFDSQSNLTDLLVHLRFPSSTQITLTCRGGNGNDVDFSDILSALSNGSHFSQCNASMKVGSPLATRALRISPNSSNKYGNRIQFEAWSEDPDALEDLQPKALCLATNPRVRLLFYWNSPLAEPHVFQTVTAAVRKALFCQNLNLMILLDPTTTRHEWVQQRSSYLAVLKEFETSPALHSIFTSGMYMEPLLTLLDSATGSEQTGTRKPFPALRKVWFHDADFTGYAAGRGSIIDPHSLLQDTVKGRLLDVLCISSAFGWTKGHTRLVQEYVTTLVWDGVEGEVVAC
ncbi:unnamed protein product [Cyclocybe aegerita]|uniref:Uncharacterized protein n=1 Tax=Cyclocybe aegerita TaxID=1973307 RepID=A0A8S0VYJ9_CYCAE|nr:unnamed protein product [Cyclocybe aegerita]